MNSVLGFHFWLDLPHEEFSAKNSQRSALNEGSLIQHWLSEEASSRS